MNSLLQTISQKDMTQPLSTITRYGYDTQDNQTSVTDPNTNITQYWFDDFGRKNQTTSPDTGITKYIYDEAGNLIQRVDAKGTIVNYIYDALNRITAIQFPSDPNQNITFTYDSVAVTNGIGRLTGRTDPSGTYAFHYYPDGKFKKEEKTITGGGSYTTEYEYNKNGVLIKITYPTGRIINYDPDSVDKTRIFQVRINDSSTLLASGINYLPFGGITSLTYGNNLTLSQGYDTQYRITSIVAGSVLNLAYGYDPNGNITSITNLDPPGGEVLEAPGVYSYQTGTNKLTHIEATPPSDFGYDANANITTENTWTYVYDLSNQLIRVLDGANQIAEYTFNGAGQRIKKVAGGTTKIFHYDLWGHLIAETNQSGQMIAEYVYLGDQLLSMIKPGENVYYFHNEHLGTPQILTNESQAIAWKAAYTPFGEAVVSIATVENPFRFPGQYYDTETGLHYNYFRYYDPTTGRYLTPDPIGLEGGINLWAYSANNPVMLVDPFGLCPAGTHEATPVEVAKILAAGRDIIGQGLPYQDMRCNQFVSRSINKAFPGALTEEYNTFQIGQGQGPFEKTSSPAVGELALFKTPGHVVIISEMRKGKVSQFLGSQTSTGPRAVNLPDYFWQGRLDAKGNVQYYKICLPNR